MPIHACVAHQISQKVSTENKWRKCSTVNLSGLCLTSIPKSVIKNRRTIEILIMDNNFLTEDSFENIPKFRNLRKLSVKGNKIRNFEALISNLLRNCPSLEELIVKNNPGWGEEQENAPVGSKIQSSNDFTILFPKQRSHVISMISNDCLENE
ncbi:unnamed protein product [Caenorhabditis brenneri]